MLKQGLCGCSQDGAHAARALPVRHSHLCSSLLTPAFDFYQRLRAHLGKSPRASTPLRSSPYVPQCDAFGSWEPVQCHAATGEGGGRPGEAKRHHLEERAGPGGQVSWTLGPCLAAGGKSFSFSGLWLSHLYNGSSGLLPAQRSRGCLLRFLGVEACDCGQCWGGQTDGRMGEGPYWHCYACKEGKFLKF